MRLAHVSIPRLIPYTHASYLQELLIQRQFRHKDLVRSSTNLSSLPTPPPPTVLTFSTPPTYTIGRRYLPSTATTNPSPNDQQYKYTITPAQVAHLTSSRLAEFYPTPRGGDLTFHGPGQLTAYPILDLRTQSLTPRRYIRLLESAIIKTCSSLGVADTHTTEDPGVWLPPTNELPVRKVCAIGVQVRRGITGHGIGFNVVDVPLGPEYIDDDGERAEGSLSWGFGRIVACGLEGKGVTWLGREGGKAGMNVEEVGRVFVEQLARALGIDEICGMSEADLLEAEKGLEGKAVAALT